MSLGLRWVTNACRYATAPWRVLPGVVIIGAQRGGTTSLHRYLVEHPDVHAAQRKELHYFDRHYGKSTFWYRGHFPTRRAVGPTGVTIDATPYMLFHPLAPQRVSARLPEGRFIAILRDPVERAHSQWAHNLQRGIGPDDFEQALSRELRHIDQLTEDLRSGRIRHSLEHQRYSFIRRGEYVDQLERWWGEVGRERVLVLASEDLFARPGEALAEVHAFVGLQPHTNAGGDSALHAASRSAMSVEIRDRLRAHFRPFNERLFQRLGRTLPWQ
jgi:hypothetical protein